MQPEPVSSAELARARATPRGAARALGFEELAQPAGTEEGLENAAAAVAQLDELRLARIVEEHALLALERGQALLGHAFGVGDEASGE